MTARESSCVQFAERKPYLIRLFGRLYVLRKQIFHGCSKDRGAKNRPSLRAAVPVLERLVSVFIDLVDGRAGDEALLENPPYPPSQGGGQWNAPRVLTFAKGAG